MSAILKQKLIDIANGFTKYGLWKGGGSGALSEMTDVTFSNLKENDILKYNGSVWINDDSLQNQINTLNSNDDNLQTQINTLNSNFENKFAAIEIDVTTTQKIISYPNGFNCNNCVVTTLYYTPYNTWVVPEHNQSSYGCELILAPDAIVVTAKTNATKKIRMLFTRIDL